MFSTKINFDLPSKTDIREAHKRIKPYIHQTPLLSSEGINNIFSAEILFKCENFQKVGAFKSRGAINAVFSLSDEEVKNGVCTHSSGNHAQALARAAKLRGVKAFIVMPKTAPKVKVEAVKSYGGIIEFCEPNLAAREKTLLNLQKKTNATEIHPYDNLKVIEGQATAALEVFDEQPNSDYIIAPVGGGGLFSGTLLSRKYFSPKTKAIAAEPQNANDAYQSLQKMKFIPSENPNTIADGLLTSLGKYSFPIILNLADDIICVSEKDIVDAMKIIYQRLKIVIEPSSAVTLAAIKNRADYFENKKIALILSGGNIDLDIFFDYLKSKNNG